MILAPATQDIDELLSQPFDFVVAGGGTGGLALAALLSDDPSMSVLVLDRGVHRPDDLKVLTPQLWATQLGDPTYDSGHLSVPQLNGAPTYFSASRVLGGTSTLNAMTWIQVPRNELQAWSELGNATWDWETVLSHSKEAESFIVAQGELQTAFEATAKPEYRGDHGPVPLTHSTFFSSLLPEWYETLRKVGIQTNHDPRESGTNAGAWTVQNAITRLQERASAAKSYYLPRADRTNLVVITEAQVHRVLLNDTADSDGLFAATGVEFVYAGAVHVARVRREVIVSAGSFASPKILELSGIGDPSILGEAGVECKVDLPGVGENFQDHWAFNHGFKVNSKHTTLDQLRDPAVMAAQTEEYLKSRTGLLSAGQTSLVYITANHLFDAATIRSMQEDLQADIRTAPPGLQEQYTIMQRWLADPDVPFIEMYHFFFPGAPPPANEKFLAMCTFLTHPFSRGSVHIKSNDPDVPVVVDPRLFTHPLDKKFALAAVNFARERLAKTEPLASALDGAAHPPENATQQDLEAVVEGVISGHAIGTCSMLPREKRGVVDTDLKVWGTSNLRVVDASIFPLHTSNHPQATVYATAHKAAASILQRWRE
ncbi:alcohol oxidase [Exidia glandulosa HHB12029]|uniref:Alcohol oxidase n=1 Tax=Exidia glandulosa HHB12029 TaxID=1314781 RepID=A0A166BUL7_EXIGL|nr:alcohol oxidase [Exidia glandulosa HHB12029]